MSRGAGPRPAVILAVVLLVLAGCRSERRAEVPQEMFFEVDTTLLGPVHAEADLGFTIRPPRGWAPVPDSLLEAAAAELDSARPFRPWAAPHLAAAFQQDPGGALLLVTRFPRPVSDAERDSLGNRERDALAAAASTRNFREAVYLHQGSVVRQFLVTGPDRVAFRLLVTPPGGTPMKLDYIVPSGIYPHLVKSIESSIGSVTYRP